MMKQPKGKRSLEAYKIFPYVAWGLIAGFIFFVYNIFIELQDTTAQLERQTTSLQEQVDADPGRANFDSYNENRFQPN
jgi:hypothetical protein